MLNGTVIETTTEMKHLIKTDLTIVKEWVECGTLFESEDGYFGIRAGEGLVYIGSNSFNVEINKYLDFQFVPEKTHRQSRSEFRCLIYSRQTIW